MNTSHNIPCAQDPCRACIDAGRLNYAQRVLWHAAKLRRRERISRWIPKRRHAALALACLAVGVWTVVALKWWLS